MKIVTFNAEEIEIDAIQAVDAMTFTYTEFQQIQNDTEEVVRIIKLGTDNATKNESNSYYEFEKKNRIKVCDAVTEEKENHEKIIKELFITNYKCKLNKLDRLNSDIINICTYMKEVIMSVTILNPKNISSCTRADVEIFAQNFRLF